MINIKNLWLYPVKSLRGFQVKSATLTPLGFQWDRHWMLIDENGKFLTQRKIPDMVLIHTRLTGTHLILSKENMEDYHLPLAYPKENTARAASIWKDTCNVVFEEEGVNNWLKKALDTDKPIFMVRMKKETQRTQSKAHLLGEKTRTLFADAAPFLVTNTASLSMINNQLANKGGSAVSMEQFRPNIVIEGLNAFEEHSVKELRHNNYTLKHCYPCQRCIMTTIDVESAIVHPEQEPFMSLMKINTMPDNDKAPAFGENAILTNGEGKSIKVGDLLEVD